MRLFRKKISDLDAIPEEFWQGLACSTEKLLLLDYDGTLASFHVKRDRAVPSRRIRRLLDAIIRSKKTRVVIISGRSAKEVAHLLGTSFQPEIWGSHGYERLTSNGDYSTGDLDEKLLETIEAAGEAVSSFVESEYIEMKPAGIAVHWRGKKSSYAHRIRQKVENAWGKLFTGDEFSIHIFDGGIELRVRGFDKGHVIEQILGETGDNASIAYLGDDLTDEDAFRALNGKGLTVLVNSTRRETSAMCWLKPRELRKFLFKWFLLTTAIKRCKVDV